MRRATAIVALWPGAARTLERSFGVSPHKITVIPNAVPATRFEPLTEPVRAQARGRFGIPEHVPVLLYVGALVPDKGVDTAIRAVELLPGVHLVVVGDGPERPTLEALAGRHAAGRVHFEGSLRSTVEAYAVADVVVLASHVRVCRAS